MHSPSSLSPWTSWEMWPGPAGFHQRQTPLAHSQPGQALGTEHNQLMLSLLPGPVGSLPSTGFPFLPKSSPIFHVLSASLPYSLHHFGRSGRLHKRKPAQHTPHKSSPNDLQGSIVFLSHKTPTSHKLQDATEGQQESPRQHHGLRSWQQQRLLK